MIGVRKFISLKVSLKKKELDEENFPFTLDYVPFTPSEWRKLEEQAESFDNKLCSDSYLLDIIDTWILESYKLPGLCEVASGDVVIDCGSYTGNTTKYFSEKVGDTGHIYGFEASEEIFKQYQKNVASLNNVTVLNAAVSDQDGFVHFSADNIPGSHISANGTEVKSISIDNYVASNNIKKVNFIKMDIEGAELAALNGAVNTIKTYRPKMALSAYHKFEDVYALPNFIHSIDQGYQFYLRHFSDNLWETVLFCVPCSSTNTMNKVYECEDYSKMLHVINMIRIIINSACHLDVRSKVNDLLASYNEIAIKYDNSLKELKHLNMVNSVMRRKLEKYMKQNNKH